MPSAISAETSGVLLLAKRRAALTDVHAQLRHGRIAKRYRTVVLGDWSKQRETVRVPLRKFVSGSGERRVVADEAGRHERNPHVTP